MNAERFLATHRVALSRAQYPPHRAMKLETRPMIEMRIKRVGGVDE